MDEDRELYFKWELKSEISCEPLTETVEPLTETFEPVTVSQEAIPSYPDIVNVKTERDDVDVVNALSVKTVQEYRYVKAVPEDVKAVPEDVKAVPENVKAVLEDVKAVPEDVKAVPEDVKAVLEDVKAVPEDVKAVPVIVWIKQEANTMDSTSFASNTSYPLPDEHNTVPANVVVLKQEAVKAENDHIAVPDDFNTVPDECNAVPDDFNAVSDDSYAVNSCVSTDAVPDDVGLVFDYYNRKTGEENFWDESVTDEKFFDSDHKRGDAKTVTISAEKKSVTKTTDELKKLETKSNLVEFKTNRSDRKKKSAIKKQKLECPKCDKMFDSRVNLKGHLTRHERSKKYFCAICDRKFSDPSYYEEHLLYHENKAAFHCDVCGKNYKSSNSLRKHNQQQHSVLKKTFECKICAQVFPRKFNLERHSLSHLLKLSKNLQFKCKQCDKHYTTKNALDIHSSSIHATEKPLKCSKCEKRFSIKSRLSAHFAVHTLPYQCHICSHRFSALSGLEAHLRVHSGVKTYDCKLCDQSFKLKWRLTKHVKLKHRSK